MEININVKM